MSRVTYIDESSHKDLDTLINHSGLPQIAMYISYVCTYVPTITQPYTRMMSHTYMSHVSTDLHTPINDNNLLQSVLYVSCVCTYVCAITRPYSRLMSHTYMSHVTTTLIPLSTPVVFHNQPVSLICMYICMCHHSAIFMNDITYVYESYHNDLDTLTNHSGLLQSALYHPRMEKSHSCWPRTADMEWLRLVGSLKIIGLFCKRALLKRRYSTKETYNFKEPTNRSHPICSEMCFTTTELVQ